MCWVTLLQKEKTKSLHFRRSTQNAPSSRSAAPTRPRSASLHASIYYATETCRHHRNMPRQRRHLGSSHTSERADSGGNGPGYATGLFDCRPPFIYLFRKVFFVRVLSPGFVLLPLTAAWLRIGHLFMCVAVGFSSDSDFFMLLIE